MDKKKEDPVIPDHKNMVPKIEIWEQEDNTYKVEIDHADGTPKVIHDPLSVEAKQQLLEAYQQKNYTFEEHAKKPEPKEEAVISESTDPGDIKTLAQELIELTGKITVAEEKVINCTNLHDAITNRMEEIENRILLNVTEEKLPGHLVYPDSVSQNIEVAKRMDKNPTINRLNSEVYAEVTAEAIPEGKKIYANEKARTVETGKRLREKSEYNDLRGAILRDVQKLKGEERTRFSNEISRRIETNNRLKEQKEFQQKLTEKQANTKAMQQAKLIFDHLKRRFRMHDILTRYLTIMEPTEK